VSITLFGDDRKSNFLKYALAKTINGSFITTFALLFAANDVSDITE